MITVFICLWYVKSTKCSIITAFSQVACDILELSDLEQLESRLENQREAIEVFPKLEDLVLNIADVMEPSLVKNHKNNKHKIWCSKHWKNIITRLETWRQQIKQLPVRVCVCVRVHLYNYYIFVQDELKFWSHRKKMIKKICQQIRMLPLMRLIFL